MKVYKITLKIGFDCNPKLEIGNEECEVNSEGKILPKNEKNSKMTIPFSERRMVLNDNFSSPGVDVFCYLEKLEKDEVELTVKKMYEDAQRTMQWLSRIFSERVDKMAIPNSDVIARRIEELMKDGSKNKKWILKGELFELLANATRKKADELVIGMGLSQETLGKWTSFCENHITEELFQGQMDSLRSVEQFDERFGFASEDSFATATSNLPEATAKDLVLLFKQESEADLKK